jgi:hypothetical protein
MKRAALLGALVVLSGCNSVLGIDKAALEDGGGNVEPTSCEAYCSAVMTNCTGANAEYLNTDVCLAMCPKFEIGVQGSTSGDTRECRIYHANAAADDPVTHCRHAGPLGYPACQPSPCTPFCTLDFGACASQSSPPYSSEVVCQNTCADPDAGFPYQTTGGASDINQQSGNTLNCRLYHLESAYAAGVVADPASVMLHCGHTAQVSATCK